MYESKLSIAETEAPKQSLEGGESRFFKDSLSALRNEMSAEIFKETVADKCQQETVKKTVETDSEQIKSLTTKNESLEGSRHPLTEVPFERKEVINEQGKTCEGVFPDFESIFTAELPEKMWQESDANQFGESNDQLKDWVEDNPEKAEKMFDQEQIDDIANNYTPEGYVWHHTEDRGEMQLVDAEIHAKTGHTGGKSVWGGGSENR